MYSRINRSVAWLVAVLAMAVLAGPVWAVPVSGVFTAEQSCPVFVSKNKQTNPDGARLTRGERYVALEANIPSNPDWYRLRVTSADPPERWVSADCGRFQAAAGGGIGGGPTGTPGGGGAACRIAGRADSYVLAVSWQPAFCETKPEKPECAITDPKVYQARNFTLHGLWPNRNACGKNYGYCGAVKTQPNDFCNYPALGLDASTRTALAQVMPSVQAGSCLERHEWHKHGTCQTAWSNNAYFDVSADLTRQFNESGVAYFMNRRLGRTVRTADFLARVDAVLGEGAQKRATLVCKNGMLVEVRVALPSDLRPGEDLDALIGRAAPQGGSDCGSSFRVDRIGR